MCEGEVGGNLDPCRQVMCEGEVESTWIPEDKMCEGEVEGTWILGDKLHVGGK